MNTEYVYALAGKAAFYDLDFCPGTGFYEVIDDEALDVIVRYAQGLINKLGISLLPINQHHVAMALWGIDPETFDREMAKYQNKSDSWFD